MATDVSRTVLPMPDRAFADTAAEDMDHLITPEERIRIAMARQ